MQIVRLRKNQKLFFAVLAIFGLIGLFCTLFHHHADGQQHDDCQVCRLAQQIVSFFVFAAVALISLVLASKKFFAVPIANFTPLFLSSNLQDRAPPIFSC